MMENELDQKLKLKLERIKNASAPADLKRQILEFGARSIALETNKGGASRWLWPALASSLACALALVLVLRTPEQTRTIEAPQLVDQETDQYLAALFDEADELFVQDEILDLEDVV